MRNNVSYLRSAPTGPVMEETIGACFDRAARQFADQEALVVSHQRLWWTYRQLRVRVDSLAIGLLGLGLAPRDRIGIWSANCAESVLTQFAAAKAGLILVNIDPAYGSVELEYVLKKAGCRALILAPSSKSTNHFDILRSVAPEIDWCAPGKLEATRVPALKSVIRLGTGSTRGMVRFDDLVALRTPMEKQALFAVGSILRPTDPIAIQFTSSTGGIPQPATLTHRDILKNGFFAGEPLNLTESDGSWWHAARNLEAQL
jgi:fatty-acyl-CoA synthase